MNKTSATERIVALHKLHKIYRLISPAEERRAGGEQNTLEILYIFFFYLVFKLFCIKNLNL